MMNYYCNKSDEVATLVAINCLVWSVVLSRKKFHRAKHVNICSLKSIRFAVLTLVKS